MSDSRRTTIVIDPIVHKAAKRLASQAGLNFKEFMGHLITHGVQATANAIAGIVEEKIKEKIKQDMLAYFNNL